MRKLALAALPILLLLAVATPSCLAAENSTSDKQPAPLYSKLPPLQLSGSPLAQKEYLQAALWLAQQHSPITTLPRTDEKVFGLTSTEATVLSPIVSAIAIIISIAIAILNMEKNTSAIHKDFKFRMYQLNLEEKKKVMLNFFESTSISAIYKNNFSMDDIRTQMTMLEMLMDNDFYKHALSLFTFLDDHLGDLFSYAPTDSIRIRVTEEYELLHLAFAAAIRRALSGEDFDPALTASK